MIVMRMQIVSTPLALLPVPARCATLETDAFAQVRDKEPCKRESIPATDVLKKCPQLAETLNVRRDK